MTIADDRPARELGAPSEGIADPALSQDVRNLVIMASAGSGKTFQLTNRFLRLLLEHVEPGTILASTFTRLAAGEIRDRCMERLAKAASSEHERAELAGHLGAPLTRDAALDLLERLARSLHRLQVRTLDSFFAGIVHCFSLEMGLDPAADIVDEDTGLQLRREAIARMLDERDPQPLIDLLRVLTEGAAARSVTDEIDAQIVPLYELYREAPAEAWEAIQLVPMKTREEVRDAIEALAAVDPAVFPGDRRFITAWEGDCALLRACRHSHPDDWIGLLGKGLFKAIEERGGEYFKKPIPPAALERYKPLLAHCRAVVHNAIVHRTRSTRDLLARFDRRYEEVKRERKALTFADLTHRVSRADQLGRLDEVWFRLDATLHHLLLDEMQDTNVQQWRALLPIVTETLANADRTFFCVGDVKQSIYGWREASPEILETMREALGVEQESLAKSWRSSPIIMQVVNQVFTDVERNPALAEHVDAARKWDAAFQPHETARTDRPGYAALHVARRAEEGEKQPGARLHDAADLIAALHAEAPDRTIGVLTRTNKAVNRLLYELGPAGRMVPASGRGGGSLTDAPAVNAVLDLLRLADHPDHAIAAFNVMHSPLGEAVGLRPLPEGSGVDALGCQRVSRIVRRQVLEHGYAAMIGRWIRAIGSKTDRRQLRRLIQLQHLAARYDRRATLRCDDFLAFVAATPVDDPAAAPVQVMTVHQSKGLEFDIVVLPELEGAITKTDDLKMLFERDDSQGPAGPIRRIARHMKKETWSLLPDLAPLFHQHVKRQARESLCLLYVAMTRARHALHMMIDPPRANERTLPRTLSSILRRSLAPTASLEPGERAFEIGDPQWHEHEQPEQAEPAAIAPAPVPIRFAPETAARGLARTAAQAMAASQAAPRSLRERLHLPDDEARQRGTAIHAMFETIEWIEDWQPDANRLAAIARAAAPRRGGEWAERQAGAFLSIIENPVVRTALSRRGAAPDADVRLWRERPYARLVNGAVQRGFIDRLVATFHNEICIAATLLDFKTDPIAMEDAEAHAAIYREQLRAYRDAAAEELALPPEQIEMKLLFVQCGALVTL